ncbi:MAG: PAS domain S-box protein [Gammaproteobacteria bacterium]|nr:PAS domain S-box protein [Gammaproteobacteria bacterium]
MTDGQCLDPSIAQHVVEQAPDALILVDAAGLIVYANNAVASLFGYGPDELTGRSIECLVPERFREVHARYRKGFNATPAAREMGARLVALSAVRRDGSEFPTEIRLAPVRESGRLLVVAAVRDISERARITEELRAARAEADVANQAKSRFLATASHDLRQPLQTLQLLTAALRRQVDGPATEIIERQQHALQSMADLLNTLLDISKLESGAVKPTLADVSVGDLLAEIRQQFEQIATARGLALTIAAGEEFLHTDRVLLRQMVQNLLTNALQYTRVGGVGIVTACNETHFIIEVTDTGVGIAPDQIERIFDEYYRVERPGGGRRGAGLGLNIVRQISRLLGYEVEVSSELGRGTKFRLLIPTDRLVEPVKRAASVPADQRAETPVEALKPAVLIIEDDDAVRGALELILKLDGYPVWVAATAAAAMQLFAREGPNIDMVVTDFHLNGPENGLQVLDSLRSTAGRDLPAVVLSGDTSPILRHVGALSRVQLLRKPIEARHLIRTLEQLFGSGEAAGSGP